MHLSVRTCRWHALCMHVWICPVLCTYARQSIQFDAYACMEISRGVYTYSLDFFFDVYGVCFFDVYGVCAA